MPGLAALMASTTSSASMEQLRCWLLKIGNS
jgi:hypothetical protein